MLQELRQKPKHIREKYAFWGALSITAAVALVWGASLSMQFGVVGENVVAEESERETDNAGAFSRSFSDVKNNVAGAWNAFTNASSNAAINNEATTSEERMIAAPDTSTTTATTTPVFASTSANIRRPVLIATTSIQAEEQ